MAANNDKLRALVAKWPNDRHPDPHTDAWTLGYLRAKRECAAELEAALAAMGGEGCHCATCTCNPGMTPAIRFDASPAEREGAVRDQLVRMGWTPPGSPEAQAEAVPVAGFRDSVLNSAKFRASCYALVGIVEGVEACGRRWAANGERLKDTQEWVAFYNCVASMRNGTFNQASAEQAQQPAQVAVPEDVLALLRDLSPALDAYEFSGRKSEIKDGVLHWTLNEKHYDALRLRTRVEDALAANKENTNG